ncbi:leucine-rich repeat-containing protein 71-like isoform X2 [Oscarella lobularis]|uniref:leucine-rich repeat-containing protein 71-like isoform X2 n=1 Tax=Oscarella lobularis TaxID=121494 RepID=UPI0033134FBC
MTKKGAQKAAEKPPPESEPSNPDGDGLTGIFETDFPLLCVQEEIHAVDVVVLSPKGASVDEAEPKITENVDFFRPKVLVELEDESVRGSVATIHIRGWKVDEKVLNVLTLALPLCSTLTTIKFWNVGLDKRLLEKFAHLINQFNIKNVSLSGNPIPGGDFSFLFDHENSPLQNLSLRGNCINDVGAQYLGECLPANQSLLVLDLSHNRISSVGAKHIVAGLRINRTLLSLSLANNKIDDEGVGPLAEVLARFALSHHEIVARRMYHAEKKQAAEVVEKKPTVTLLVHASPEKKTLKSNISGSQIAGKDKGKEKSTPPTKKREAPPKKEEKAKKDEKELTSGRGKKISSADQKKGRTKGKKHSDHGEEGAKPSLLEHCNPLVEPVEEVGGKKYILGNRALTNLNLSYNYVDECGLAAFLATIKFQSTLRLPLGSGLMRLSLDHNCFPDDCPEFLALTKLMATKDPFYTDDDSTIQEEQ